jgi:hypothetical protein
MSFLCSFPDRSSVISMTDAMSLRSGAQQQQVQEQAQQQQQQMAPPGRVGAASPPSTLGSVPAGSSRAGRQHSAHASTYNAAYAYSPHMNQQVNPSSLATRIAQFTVPSGVAMGAGGQPFSPAQQAAATVAMFNNGQQQLGGMAHGHSALPAADMNTSGYFGSLPPYMAYASAQSFTGGALYHQPPIQGELGHALTRPGVVPSYANQGDFMQPQPYASPQCSAYGSSPTSLLRSTSYGAYGYSPHHASVRSTPSNGYGVPPTPPSHLTPQVKGKMTKRGSNGYGDMVATPSSLNDRFPNDSRRFSDPLEAHLEDIATETPVEPRLYPVGQQSEQHPQPAEQQGGGGGGIGSLLSQQLAQHGDDSSDISSQMVSQQQQQQGQFMQQVPAQFDVQAQQQPQQTAYYNRGQQPSSSYNMMYQAPSGLAPYAVSMNIGSVPVGSAGNYYNPSMISGLSAPDMGGQPHPQSYGAHGVQYPPAGLGGGLAPIAPTGIGGAMMNQAAAMSYVQQTASLGNMGMGVQYPNSGDVGYNNGQHQQQQQVQIDANTMTPQQQQQMFQQHQYQQQFQQQQFQQQQNYYQG